MSKEVHFSSLQVIFLMRALIWVTITEFIIKVLQYSVKGKHLQIYLTLIVFFYYWSDREFIQPTKGTQSND